MGPMEAFIAWQALVLAVIVVTVTQGVKYILDTIMDKVKRKKSKLISRVLLPIVPLALGFVGGAFIPLRPDMVTDYVSSHDAPAWLAYGAWGFVTGGVFGDYLYTRVKKFMTHGEPDA